MLIIDVDNVFYHQHIQEQVEREIRGHLDSTRDSHDIEKKITRKESKETPPGPPLLPLHDCTRFNSINYH